MIALSVNVNKVATLRNSRGGKMPSVVEAAQSCLDAGAAGITVHPRADQRHIRPHDVTDLAALLAAHHARGGRRVEFNIEGDPREQLIDLVLAVHPDQCTLVPVTPGEITSHAGWPADTSAATLGRIVRQLRDARIRVSLFVNPTLEEVDVAAELGVEMVELHTGSLANAFTEKIQKEELEQLRMAARAASESNLQVNAGHGINYKNIALIHQIPYLSELNIGHAIVSRAMWVGLENAVKEMLAAMANYPE